MGAVGGAAGAAQVGQPLRMGPTFALFQAMRQEAKLLASETITARMIMEASPGAVFAVLVGPAKHAAIDGTGWVRDPLDRQALSASRQIFRMAFYHPGHPDGDDEMANRVEAFDPAHSPSRKSGYDAGDGILRIGSWIWRYDLTPLGPSETEVRHSYDWTACRRRCAADRPSSHPSLLSTWTNSLTRASPNVSLPEPEPFSPTCPYGVRIQWVAKVPITR